MGLTLSKCRSRPAGQHRVRAVATPHRAITIIVPGESSRLIEAGAMMVCDDCEAEMERETVLLIVHVRGKPRSVGQPGWYCWTCRTSKHAAGDDVVEPPRRPKAARPSRETGR